MAVETSEERELIERGKENKKQMGGSIPVPNIYSIDKLQNQSTY